MVRIAVSFCRPASGRRSSVNEGEGCAAHLRLDHKPGPNVVVRSTRLLSRHYATRELQLSWPGVIKRISSQVASAGGRAPSSFGEDATLARSREGLDFPWGYGPAGAASSIDRASDFNHQVVGSIPTRRTPEISRNTWRAAPVGRPACCFHTPVAESALPQSCEWNSRLGWCTRQIPYSV